MLKNKLNKIKKHLTDKDNVILFSILFLALILRIWNIGIWDSPWGHDEMAHLLVSAKLDLIGQGITPFPNNGLIARLLSLPAILFFREISKALLIARLIRVLFGVGSIIIFYLFTKDYYNEKTALITTFLISIFPSHVFISRVAISQSASLFFCILSLYFLYKFHLKQKNKKEKQLNPSIKNKKESPYFYLYFFTFVAGLGISTHLAATIFIFSILVPYLLIFKPKITKNSFFVSSFILIILCFPTIRYFISKDYNEPFTSLNAYKLPNVKNELLKEFLGFLSFLGGDIGSEVEKPIYMPSPLFLIFIPLFLISCFCSKNRNRKDKFLLSSIILELILICFVIFTPFYHTHSGFHPLNFYITIPFISLITSKGVLSSYKKYGALIIILMLSLSIANFSIIFKETSNVIKNFYPFCIKNVSDKILKLDSNSIILGGGIIGSQPLEYRLYEENPNLNFKVDYIENVKLDELMNESLVIFVFPSTTNVNIESKKEIIREEKEINNFIKKVDSSSLKFSFIENMTCEEYDTLYQFYKLNV